MLSAVIDGDYPKVVENLKSDINFDQINRTFGPLLKYAVGWANTVSDAEQIKWGRAPQSHENLSILKALIEAGADPNTRGDDGGTALFTAVYNNRIGSIWLLMLHGADPEIENIHGHTAAYYGRMHGYNEAVQLIELCSRVNCTNLNQAKSSGPT